MRRSLRRSRWPLTVVAIYALLAAAVFSYIESHGTVSALRVLLPVLLLLGFVSVSLVAWVLAGSRRRMRAVAAAGLVLVAAGALWLNNHSREPMPGEAPYLVAHRGVGQTMFPEHDSRYRCLSRIRAPEHDFIENTLASTRAAFEAGAHHVEFDIRPTADGEFAVFHDGTLDCKTEASGAIDSWTMADLRRLDVGFGYRTVDGDYPLRGKGIGLMPSLEEMLDAFPGHHFLVNAKFGADAAHWDNLIERLRRRVDADRRRLAVFGVTAGVERLHSKLPEIAGGSRELAMRCMRDYLLLGWTGRVPGSCHGTITGTWPETGWMLWGWPTTFVERMNRVGTLVILHPRDNDERRFAGRIPAGYTGAVQTDHILHFRSWAAVDFEGRVDPSPD